MYYDEIDIKINKYLENRMTALEQESFESDLQNNYHISNDFNSLKGVFELLDSQEPVKPPTELISNLLKIAERPKPSYITVNRILAKSLIAAGFYITLFDKYTLLRVLYDFSDYISNALFYLNNIS